MFKKIIKSINISQHEKSVARYMKEVREIQEAKLTRRELFKMGLTAGVGGLSALGGRSFLPNLAQADGGSSGTTTIISPPCTMPWSDPLPIPKTPVSVGNFQGPEAEKGQCQEKHTLWNPGRGKFGDFEDFTEARTEEHQRWK